MTRRLQIDYPGGVEWPAPEEWGPVPVGPELPEPVWEFATSTALVARELLVHYGDQPALTRGEDPFVVGHPLDPGWALYESKYVLPQRFFAVVTEGEHPPCVLEFVVGDNNKVRCSRLSLVSEKPITGAQLRNVKVETYLNRAKDLVAIEVERNADGSLRVSHADAREESLRGWFDAYARTTPTRRRGVRLSDDEMRRVADVYRDALAAGEPPTKAVSTKLYTSRPNAARWVSEARRRGLLGDAPGKRRAGEIRKEETSNG